MPRFSINDELSFRYPKECSIQKKQNGRAFRLEFDGLKKDKESYWVKWINAKSPAATWGWLSSSPFDKKYDLESLTRDKKVEGFRLKPLPDLRKLHLGTGQYASFRGSEYFKEYSEREWIEMTWSRIYAYEEKGKIKFLGIGFTASGEAKAVAERVRKYFINFQSGFLFKPNSFSDWQRVEFPVKKQGVNPASRPIPGTKPQTIQTAPRVTDTTPVMETKQCSTCYGSGTKICGACGGTGGRSETRVSYDWEGNPEYNYEFVPCYSCSGGYTTCGLCGGKGYVRF